MTMKTIKEHNEFLLKVLSTLQENCNTNLFEDVLFFSRGEDARVEVNINISDLLAWGCADCEPITPENLSVLEQACDDLEHVPGISWQDAAKWATSLWGCRVRISRPQSAYYDIIPKELHHLFDACGLA